MSIKRIFIKTILCLVFIFPGMAKADDWGCQVLLCLSNPAGPMAVGECVPPIEKLYYELAHFNPFPTCDMGGAESKNYAKNEYRPFDDCPPKYPIWAGDSTATRGYPSTRTCRNNERVYRYCPANGPCQLHYDSISYYANNKPNMISVVIEGKLFTTSRW